MTKKNNLLICKFLAKEGLRFCFLVKKTLVVALALLLVIPQMLLPVLALADTVPVADPVLAQSCGLDLVMVLDNSSSITDGRNGTPDELGQMKNAFKEFIASLTGTPTEFSVISFENYSYVRQAFTANPVLVKSAIDNIVWVYNKATNWQDGLLKAKKVLPNREAKQNLIIFASDGNPTVNNDSQGTGWQMDDLDLENAILEANDIKQSHNTRIVTLGIGDAVNEANLRKISGSLAEDHYNVDNFEELKTVLRDLATGMCGGTITVSKKIGVEGNWVPASGWTFDIGGQSKQTDAINGQTEAVELNNGNYAVTETPQSAYTLFDASCAVSNGGGVVGTPDLANNKVAEIAVDTQNIIACTFYNKVQCQRIYGSETCYDDGWAKKDYTLNFPQFCEAAGTEQYEKHPDCDCVESSSKSCTGPRASTTSYTYNFSYCPAKDDLVNDDDAACESTWTCLDWANAECVSNDEGGKRKQTQSCTDQYGGAKTNEQIVGDATCGCSQTETGRACFSDGMARVEYSLGGQSYCSGTFTAEESDAACACGYSPWQNSGCAGNGTMNQTRTQTTQFDYCTALTQTVADASCALPDPVPGCTDSTATNYNSSATQDDGSCTYGQTSDPVDGKWSGWSDCSASCGGGTQTRSCTAPVNGGLECDQIDGGNATRACNTQSCGGSSGGGIAGDYNKNYFNNPAGGGVAPQVAGASIDLDDIENQINLIRQKTNDIADQVGKLGKGVMGAATMVKTGVLPVIAAGDWLPDIALPAQPDLALPEPPAALPSKPKQ
jgi:hypothetical protein